MVIGIICLSLVAASAQVGSGVAGSPPRALLTTDALSKASRARVVARKDQAEGIESEQIDSATRPSTQKGSTSDSNHARGASKQPDKTAVSTAKEVVGSSAMNASTSLSQVYRIGVGDVLDVQLADMPTARSTLFTVLEEGA